MGCIVITARWTETKAPPNVKLTASPGRCYSSPARRLLGSSLVCPLCRPTFPRPRRNGHHTDALHKCRDRCLVGCATPALLPCVSSSWTSCLSLRRPPHSLGVTAVRERVRCKGTASRWSAEGNRSVWRRIYRGDLHRHLKPLLHARKLTPKHWRGSNSHRRRSEMIGKDWPC
jgi:hypothetical protein